MNHNKLLTFPTDKLFLNQAFPYEFTETILLRKPKGVPVPVPRKEIEYTVVCVSAKELGIFAKFKIFKSGCSDHEPPLGSGGLLYYAAVHPCATPDQCCGSRSKLDPYLRGKK